MARPRRQDARRSEIVAAAMTAIADRGLIGLRLKDIAAAAALSPGSVAYYYPDLDDLLLTVHQTAVDRFYAGRRETIGAYDDAVERLGALADLGIGAPDDPMWPALYELHLNSARDPRHAEQMARLFELEASLYREVIVAGIGDGAFVAQRSPDEIAATAVTLEDGLGLHVIGRNRHLDPVRARGALRGYLAALLTCPALAIDADLPDDEQLR